MVCICMHTHTLAGMVSAVLTKRSLTNAFKKNLTAAEIIGYLSTYAHPEMKKAHRESRTSKSVVPPTVIDQIRLYEHERKRISYKPAVLISGIEDPLEYAFVKQRAQVADILLWSNDKKMLVALKKSKFDAFKPVLQERKKRMQLERDASI
jgi:transcription initiation factor TFIIH subunit 4